MGHSHRRPFLTLLIAYASPALAMGGWDESALGRARFGEPWSGPAVTTKALAGKVVLVKSWAEW